MLSLLETYEEKSRKNADIIMVEDAEIFLRPKLQKVSGDILYRLSKGNQVIFSTHSPNLLANFNSRQIRQMVQGDLAIPRFVKRQISVRYWMIWIFCK